MQIYSTVNGSYETNCYLFTDEETKDAAVVDCGVFDASFDAFLKSHGVEKLRYILLTHGHFDHVLGVFDLHEKYGGQIVIGREDAASLLSEEVSLNRYIGYGRQTFISPDLPVEEGSVLPFGRGEIRVMSAPGHTPGGVCYFYENAMFSGDTLFRLSMGRTDMPGGSTRTLFSSLRRIGEIEGDYVVYPGHGEFSTLGFEKKNNRFLFAR